MMKIKIKEMYSEVYSVLNLLGDEYINKLPKNLYKLIQQEKLETYNPIYSNIESLKEKNIKRESIAMLALFHVNYWCNSVEEKDNLKNLFKENEHKYSEEVKKKYNQIISKKCDMVESRQQDEEVKYLSAIKHKESILNKILNTIKNIFNSKKF